MIRSITLDSQKALIKYFKVIMKGGSGIDIKKIIEILTITKEAAGLKFDDHIVSDDIP